MARKIHYPLSTRRQPGLARLSVLARQGARCVERQLFRALAQLERIQRLRQGEAVPAPLTVDGSDPAWAEGNFAKRTHFENRRNLPPGAHPFSRAGER